MKLRYIFIPFLIILVMSHNAAAVDLSVGIGFHASGQNPQWHDDTNTTSGNWHTGRWVYGGNSGNANGFESFNVRQNSGSNFPIYSSYYLELTGRIQFAGRNDKWNTSGWWIYSEVGNCAIIDFDSTEVQTHLDTSSVDNTIQVYNYNLICKYTGADGGVPRVGLQVNSGSSVVSYQFSVLNWFIWKNAAGYDDSQVIAAINNVRSAINSLNSNLNTTNGKVQDILDLLEDSKNEEEDAMNDAVDESESSGNESSNDASTASSSLISAIGSFVGAVTAASPSNCRIDGDMGHMDMGQIDLCANPVPSFVQIISSLVLVAICVPFAIIMFNRFISLFRSFQE